MKSTARHSFRTYRVCTCLIAAVLVSAKARAGLDVSGEVVPSSTEFWEQAEVTVGYVSAGALSVSDGFQLTTGRANLGRLAGVTGTVDVRGTGTRWTNRGTLIIGDRGSGMVRLSDGAALSNGTGFLAPGPGSVGEVTLRGPNTTWANSGKLYIGGAGSASLEVTDGAALTNSDPSFNEITSIIGAIGGGSATVRIDGGGSTWSNFGPLAVGSQGPGTLAVSDGGGVHVNSYATVGGGPGAFGAVTVDGERSIWSTRLGLTIGADNGAGGGGSLSVSNGGAVSAGTITVGAKGSVRFGTGGGTLTTGTLRASPAQFTGTGVIHTRGLVSDLDLTFDARHGLSQTLDLSSDDANLTIQFDLLGANDLAVGYRSRGSMTIRDGMVISSRQGFVGYENDSHGVVTVEGPGSRWVSSSTLRIGSGNPLNINPSHGRLNILNGGEVVSLLGNVGLRGTGTVVVRGEGSRWTQTSGVLTIGGGGSANSGTLHVSDGGVVVSGTGTIANGSGAKGRVTIEGPGSRWDVTPPAPMRVGSIGAGVLVIKDGGVVSAASASVGSLSLLTLDERSVLSVGAGTFTNDGKVRLVASPDAAAGTHRPVAAQGFAGAGTYEAVGGAWDDADHTFSVSEPATGTDAAPVTFDRGRTQRAVVSAAGRSIVAGVLKGADASLVSFAARRLERNDLGELESLLGGGALLTDAWWYSTEGYPAGAPVHLALSAGAGYSTADLMVWRHDGARWGTYDTLDLSYDGEFASFTTFDPGAYAVSRTVPEPATVGWMAVLLALRRRCETGKRRRPEGSR